MTPVTDKSARQRGGQGGIGHSSVLGVRLRSRGGFARWPRPRTASRVRGWTCHRPGPAGPENPEDTTTTSILPIPPVPPTGSDVSDAAAAASSAAGPAASRRRPMVVADQASYPPAPTGCNSSSPAPDVSGEAFRPRKATVTKAGADLRGEALLTLARLRLATPRQLKALLLPHQQSTDHVRRALRNLHADALVGRAQRPAQLLALRPGAPRSERPPARPPRRRGARRGVRARRRPPRPAAAGTRTFPGRPAGRSPPPPATPTRTDRSAGSFRPPPLPAGRWTPPKPPSARCWPSCAGSPRPKGKAPRTRPPGPCDGEAEHQSRRSPRRLTASVRELVSGTTATRSGPSL